MLGFKLVNALFLMHHFIEVKLLAFYFSDLFQIFCDSGANDKGMGGVISGSVEELRPSYPDPIRTLSEPYPDLIRCITLITIIL